MAENTKIEWCDHTFNPWVGCTRVSDGCDNCYAAALDKRFGNDRWDKPGLKHEFTTDTNWRKPLKWQKDAKQANKRMKVFCASMSDWCDKNAPDGAMDRLFGLIRETPDLDWLLLSKRSTLIKKRLPDDWGNGYDNVWLGVTCENIKQGIPRIHDLVKIPAVVRFLSCEPLLEDITLSEDFDISGIDWAIIGGESGPEARPMKSSWLFNLINVCNSYRDNNTAVFFKQWGGKGSDKGGNELTVESGISCTFQEFPTYRHIKRNDQLELGL